MLTQTLLVSEIITLCQLFTKLKVNVHVYPCRLSRLYIGTMRTSKSHLDIPNTDNGQLTIGHVCSQYSTFVTEFIFGWADGWMRLCFRFMSYFYCSFHLFSCKLRTNYFSIFLGSYLLFTQTDVQGQI